MINVHDKKLIVFGASLLASVLPLGAISDMNGPLAQFDEISTSVCVNPIFSENIVAELHYFCKRSYEITKREDTFSFKHQDKLGRRASATFTLSPKGTRHRRASSSSDTATCVPTDATDLFISHEKWLINEPFTGIQGSEPSGVVGCIKLPCTTEFDYPGFVAYLPREGDRPPLLAVVFRGSQAEGFQPMGGIFGPSWLTNFRADKDTFPCIPGVEELKGACFHKGFLLKYLSSRLNVLSHIDKMRNLVPEEDRENLRIIFTGHSQGAALATIAALDGVCACGKRYYGEDFDNKEMPRFFVYALSSPNPTGDSKTKVLIHEKLGRENIIRHNSVFDIVTYSCLGTRQSNPFLRTIFRYVVGAETDYHPVGVLAMDDTKNLLKRGFIRNHQEDLAANINNIWRRLGSCYELAIQRRQISNCEEQHPSNCLVDLFYAVQEWANLLMGARAADGILNFVCINHYASMGGSKCLQASKVTSPERLAVDSETAAEAHKIHQSTSFDPNLPETNLNLCLWRGKKQRDAVRYGTEIDINQIFSGSLGESDDIVLAYQSDEE